jgi:hypothetical protein
VRQHEAVERERGELRKTGKATVKHLPFSPSERGTLILWRPPENGKSNARRRQR